MTSSHVSSFVFEQRTAAMGPARWSFASGSTGMRVWGPCLGMPSPFDAFLFGLDSRYLKDFRVFQGNGCTQAGGLFSGLLTC